MKHGQEGLLSVFFACAHAYSLVIIGICSLFIQVYKKK